MRSSCLCFGFLAFFFKIMYFALLSAAVFSCLNNIYSRSAVFKINSFRLIQCLNFVLMSNTEKTECQAFSPVGRIGTITPLIRR